MNLHAVASPIVAAVNPPLIGSILTYVGLSLAGDASFTGSISGEVLTVSAVASGALAPGAAFLTGATGLVVSQASGAPGGVGVYALDTAQTVTTGAMSTLGDGTPVPVYTTTSDVPMQVQALTGREIEHLDSLNIQGMQRGVYLWGNVQGLVRPADKGGDILMIPTGQTSAPYDTWLVGAVLETWDASGWCKVACVLQNPPATQ